VTKGDGSADVGQRRQPYVPAGPLRGLGVVLAVVCLLNFVVQAVGMIFFDLDLVGAGLAGFSGLVFGSAFLGMVVHSRREDARSVGPAQ
jgi:hypothetical protein